MLIQSYYLLDQNPHIDYFCMCLGLLMSARIFKLSLNKIFKEQNIKRYESITRY